MKNRASIFALAILSIFFFAQTAIANSQEPTGKSGTVSFELTDAPIDNAEVKSVFVTVTKIKVDGKVVTSFKGKQTIDLLAYQKGKTKLMGVGKLNTGTYSNISLVLDTKTDANGNAPGCYVKTVNGIKHNLAAKGEKMKEITVKKAFKVKQNARTRLVLDIDVRKAIKANASGKSKYSFVSNTELKSAVRAINKSIASKINGTCKQKSKSKAAKVIVYAYKKGTWNARTETKGQGKSKIQFKNAVTSAVADKNGNYTLAFLEEGKYEIQVAKYKDTDKDGKYEFQGMLEINGLLGLGLGKSNIIDVEAGVQADFNISIVGLLP